MAKLTPLEVELRTRAPMSEVQQCLHCPLDDCINCLNYNYRRNHESQKQGGKRTHGKA